MKEQLQAFFGGMLAMCILFVLLVKVSGHPADNLREEAADAGAGEFYIDESNERQFRWLPAKERP